MSIRKALGAMKDQTSISLAKVSSTVAPELDVAIVRATSHDDAPPDERHVATVVSLTAHSRPYTAAAAASLSRRLSRTRDYVVAVKCLSLIQRLLSPDADPHFRHDLLKPPPMLAAVFQFRDEAHSASWDHSSFVRAFAAYLDARARFLVVSSSSSPAPAAVDTEALLGRVARLHELLDGVLACRPSGGARRSRVVLAALHGVVVESVRICGDVGAVLGVLLDRFFEMGYPDCGKVFDAHVDAARQIDGLLGFYAWCDDAGVARAADLAGVNRIDDKLLRTLEQFVQERGRASQSSPPRVKIDEEIKALPAPEHHAAYSPPEKSAPAAKNTPEKPSPSFSHDLVDLREPVGENPEKKLALALFSGEAAANDGEWVTFPEDDVTDATVTSAGKEDWEVALVETASKLSRQTAPSMGGGLDTLLLNGMYDHAVSSAAAVRQTAAASGSASSVAAPRHGVLGPDGDPFAASLGVAPPAYVQMAEMERKQQLLLQEQHMWASYRHGGMQGQLAAGGMPVTMTMASYSGGYY
uniref:ENTH domain-containing protein n=1 Tax=Leersia perrieri TaxID=77586 RepID=A0A0D9WBZ6_9ORYZ